MDGTPAPATRAMTIYDVARRAGVSIASVSRVLNGRSSPRPETRDRVLAAVRELGFVPDGAARALSNRLKEVVGVVFRRSCAETVGDALADDGLADESLLGADLINRGIEIGARGHGFDLLLNSVAGAGIVPYERLTAIAGKSDGLVLHDHVLDPADIARIAHRLPVVTVAGMPGAATVNVRADNAGGMRELTRHLVVDHGYRNLAYLAGPSASPDNRARAEAFHDAITETGARAWSGEAWRGDFLATGGARVVRDLLAQGRPLPRAIVCANDQTAIGVLRVLAEHGIGVPGEIAVTGFDDIPVARHLHPGPTTVRQPARQVGAAAFAALHEMIGGAAGEPREIVLPTSLVARETCGCPA